MNDETKRALRDAFGTFATGVTVITTREADGTPRGFTANSFTSVSLDPPLLLVCLGKSARSCDVFAAADHFAVNILADDQKDVSGLFASQSPDKFRIANWQPDAQTMPLLDKALAGFSCARHQVVDAGDHLILIGRVLSFDTNSGKPLGYFKGAYFDIGLEQPLADAAAAGDVSIGAVLADGDRVLLNSDASGRVSLPSAPPRPNTVAGLIRALQDQGVQARLDHLYAVYRNTQNEAHWIIYHGATSSPAPEGMMYYHLDSLPLDKIESDAERSMLRRYQQEYRYGTFGIYHGTETEGVVHSVSGHQSYSI